MGSKYFQIIKLGVRAYAWAISIIPALRKRSIVSSKASLGYIAWPSKKKKKKKEATKIFNC